MTDRPLLALISVFVLGAFAPALAAQESARPSPCVDRSIVASAIRSPEDVRALVQCAYEFVHEVGLEEARRAFHEDERWRSGPIYVFVDEVTPISDQAVTFVYPPDPSREGASWGLLIDSFGNDWFREQHRIVSNFGEGWMYYSFTNPETGRDEPKFAYLKGLTWDGTPAAIGAGVYPRDIPGACFSEEVNAARLEASPSAARLQEFVRCAARELESLGYFAAGTLSANPRWRSSSIYVFGLDTSGNALFSGDPYSRGSGPIESELDARLNPTLQGQDTASVVNAFGESFLYYSTRNPATGARQRKVAFVKRVLSFGLPVLVGSGFYVDCPPGECGGLGATDELIGAACDAARETLADLSAMRVNYGFYTDFNPVSYVQASLQPMGYEPDLVAAVETFSMGRLSFNALGIGNPFSGIWLKAAQEPYDMVGGGITALPERTQGVEGRQVIRFGVGHISFRQSLLVRSESAINRHGDLTAQHRVGVLRGTTGEKRLLELTGIIDAAGFVHSRTRVHLAGGESLIAGEPDSELALRIAAGTGSAAIAMRVRLVPAANDRPEVLYFNSDSELVGALLGGAVDAIARGELGNLVTARDTPGLRVTAIDSESNEWGAFSYPDTPAGHVLRAAMNATITCLTANGTVGFSQWFDSGGTVFTERAEKWR
ncbi:MAG: transporter substrate-binding domain-containing protein [Acidobacteriia bacterium]|nr:transporter substrate-binding domain-containing protein [Terriglobia bacterium]